MATDMTTAPGQIPEQMTTLAQEIAKLAEGVQQVVGQGLQRRTLILLLCSQTKLSEKTVGAVIDAMMKMKGHWTTLP